MLFDYLDIVYLHLVDFINSIKERSNNVYKFQLKGNIMFKSSKEDDEEQERYLKSTKKIEISRILTKGMTEVT